MIIFLCHGTFTHLVTTGAGDELESYNQKVELFEATKYLNKITPGCVFMMSCLSARPRVSRLLLLANAWPAILFCGYDTVVSKSEILHSHALRFIQHVALAARFPDVFSKLTPKQVCVRLAHVWVTELDFYDLRNKLIPQKPGHLTNRSNVLFYNGKRVQVVSEIRILE